MKKKRIPFTIERIKIEALAHSTRNSFKKSNPFLYRKAIEHKILEEVCSHMGPRANDPWPLKDLIDKAAKCNSIKEFELKYPNEYAATKRRSLIKVVLGNIERLWEEKWNKNTIPLEAIKYATRSLFAKNNRSAYNAAIKLEILDQACLHMTRPGGNSIPEKNLFDIIKQNFPKAQKFRDRKVKIEGKPHIKGLDIDIYIPELRKGIEFNGQYWHSVPGLKRSRKDWPQEDIENYHQIKDEYFKSKNIELLHISEKDWLTNKEECVKKILAFLKGDKI